MGFRSTEAQTLLLPRNPDMRSYFQCLTLREKDLVVLLLWRTRLWKPVCLLHKRGNRQNVETGASSRISPRLALMSKIIHFVIRAAGSGRAQKLPSGHPPMDSSIAHPRFCSDECQGTKETLHVMDPRDRALALLTGSWAGPMAC